MDPSMLLSTLSSPIAPTTSTPLADFQSGLIWALVAGFLLAFLLGFGMGANDVANAFGTSVGSKVLSLRMAYALATLMETLGAILVGYNVTDTMRKGVINTELYADNPQEFLIGQIAILGGGSAWLLAATLLKLPVSTTHSIVGATLGFTLTARGLEGIHWGKIAEIVCSWVLSPALSGLVSAALYMAVDFAVLRRRNPVKCGLRALPLFYFFCIAFNAFAVTYSGSKVLGLSDVPLWAALGISAGMGVVAGLAVQFVVRPRIEAWIFKQNGLKNDNKPHLSISFPEGKFNGDNKSRISMFSLSSAKVGPNPADAPVSFSSIQLSTDYPLAAKLNAVSAKKSARKQHNERHQPFHLSPKGLVSWFFPRRDRSEDAQTLRMFSTIQVFTACFAGFAHGANDVSNAIAPLVALMSVWASQSVAQREQTPIWILLYGVAAICVGLWVLGHRVIKTVGQKMSEINPCSGFTIEFGAAVSALVASKLGLPISTTHCLVGSVVAVGSVKSGEGIDWRIFASIATSWIVTLPISALVSAAVMWLLKMSLL